MIWPRRSLTAMVSGTLTEAAAALTMVSTSLWVRRLLVPAVVTGGAGGMAFGLSELPQESVAQRSAMKLRCTTARSRSAGGCVAR